MPFGLVRGVAAGGHEAQYPAGRVGPGGAEGGPGPVDQPGAVGRDQYVVRRPVRVREHRTGEDRCRCGIINVGRPAVLGPFEQPGIIGDLDCAQRVHQVHHPVKVRRAGRVVSVPAVYVLVAKDVPSGLVEVPEQDRGDLVDKRGYRGLAGLGDDPPVARGHALREHHAIGSVDGLLQRTGQVNPRAALFHGVPHVMGGPGGMPDPPLAWACAGAQPQ